MKNINKVLLASLLATSVSQGATIIVDFTSAAPTSASTTLTGVNLGVGTADIVVTTGGGAFNLISQGIGVAGGGQGNRIGNTAAEVLTVTFSNFTGGLNASDISFEGLVAATLDSSGAFTFGPQDVLTANGVTVTGNLAGDGVAPALNFDADYIFQNADSSVALNGSDAIVLDLTTEAGDGYRLQGLELTVVPEPSSALLLSLGGIAFITRRKRS